MGDDKKVLLILRRSPYGNSLARAGLDTALAAAAFAQSVSLLFMGAGVLQLVGTQDGRAVGVRDTGRLLASLPLYDIERVYADAEAARQFGVDLTGSPLDVTPVGDTAMRDLVAGADVLLGF